MGGGQQSISQELGCIGNRWKGTSPRRKQRDNLSTAQMGGGGGPNLCQKLLSYFTSIFHDFLHYHIRIFVSHNHCQNIHFQRQYCCFKDFPFFSTHIGHKVPQGAQQGGLNRCLGNAQINMFFFCAGASLMVIVMSTCELVIKRKQDCLVNFFCADCMMHD